MGTDDVARMLLHTSMPETSGIIKSRRIKSKVSDLKSSRAVRPFSAVVVSKPSLPKRKVRASENEDSSSTMRIFVMNYSPVDRSEGATQR